MKELSLTRDKTFSEFKRNFYERFPDLSVFDCDGINLLKVVLEGLKVNYVSKFKTKFFMKLPSAIIRVYFFLQRFRVRTKKKAQVKKAINAISKKRILLRAEYLSSADNRRESRIFDVFFREIPGHQFACIAGDISQDAGIETDFNVASFREALIYGFPLGAIEINLLKQLRAWRRKFFELFPLAESDQKNIEFAIQRFFLEFRLWNRIFSQVNAERWIFRCHYHFEASILAAKKNKIKTIELQHGLISSEDIFYVMPEKVKNIAGRAMFADEVWVYGAEWKNKLLEGGEYSERQIQVFGYYPKINHEIDEELMKILTVKGNRNILLVATQTFLHEYFITYIRWLKEEMSKKGQWSDFLIVLKPHPNEASRLYEALEEDQRLVIYRGNIDAIMVKSRLLISAYSTVLVEAIRYNIPGFSFLIPTAADYINAFVEEGYSRLLQPGENPIEAVETWNPVKVAGALFAPVRNELIRSL